MTILCAGNCHVWPFDKAQDVLGSSSLCTCEAHRVAMYGLMVPYNPYGPHAPQPTLPDVPIEVFKAAQSIEDATHLSADGKRVYLQRMGNVRVKYWDDETKAYGSSFPCEQGLPADAVVLK